MACATRARASADTRSGVARARLTVAVDTSASLATSWMFAARAFTVRSDPLLRSPPCMGPFPFANVFDRTLQWGKVNVIDYIRVLSNPSASDAEVGLVFSLTRAPRRARIA